MEHAQCFTDQDLFIKIRLEKNSNVYGFHKRFQKSSKHAPPVTRHRSRGSAHFKHTAARAQQQSPAHR